MKELFLTFFLFTSFVFSHQALAVNSHRSENAMTIGVKSQMTVNDFLAVDLQNFKSADGKGLKWTQKLAFKAMQKSMARKVAKGKIEGTMSLEEAGTAAGGNLYGLLSLIFSVVGLFIPYLGLAMLIAGLVLGIIGITRDNNPTMAIIGTVLSAVFLLLILIVIAASIAWFY
ncbi:MAG: hypothetical protein M3R25_01820 [Bacteroidota bacterium]|nr:hypothetical protein [Bacteroidota bacterium]